MADMIKRKDGSYSKRGLWDNIRKNKGSGKKPTAEMLKQEKKIKNENKMGGMKKMYGGTKKKMQAGGVDKTSERFKKASDNTKARNERQEEEKRLSKLKKSGEDVSYADRTKMQKGGAKPDYLDMDGDGNKKESMKSAVASKKKMQKGGLKGNKRRTKRIAKIQSKLDKSFSGEKPLSEKKAQRLTGKQKKIASRMKYQAGGFLEPPVYDLDA